MLPVQNLEDTITSVMPAKCTETKMSFLPRKSGFGPAYV